MSSPDTDSSEAVEMHVELPEGGINDSWAYLTIHFFAAAPLEDIDRRLNEIGADSWELKASWPVTIGGVECVRMTFAR